MTQVSSNCSNTTTLDESQKFTGPELAIAMIFSFVFGAVTVLIIFLTLRMRRKKKLCFREKEMPSPGKWEGASNSVTKKVIAKHIGKSEKKSVKNECCDKTTEEPKSQQAGREHGETIHNEQEGRESGVNNQPAVTEATTELIVPAYTNYLKADDIFEDERESSGSQFAFYTLQNKNFAANASYVEKNESKHVNNPHDAM